MDYYNYCFILRPVIFKEIIIHLEVLFIARNKYIRMCYVEGKQPFPPANNVILFT